MLGLVRNRLKRFILRHVHRRNELRRSKVQGPRSVCNDAWGATYDDAGVLSIGGKSIPDLAALHGTPLYVVNRNTLVSNFERFTASFRDIYPRVEIGYSYKTNPLPGVIAELHQLGALAEVISHFELWLALQLRVPAARILFNGPGKTRAALDLAVSEGVALINIDGLAEIDLIAQAARQFGRVQPLGVRIVTSVGWSSQFGLSLQSGDAFEAFRRIKEEPNLQPVGLHFHLGTGIRDVPIYLQAVQEMLEFARTLRNELNINIGHMDFGGGFGVPTVRPMSIWDHRLVANGMPPGPVDTAAAARPEDYSRRITDLVRRYYPGDDSSLPTIYFEPGRALTSSAQSLILRVLAVKDSKGAHPKVILDGGKNIAMPTGYEVHELLPANGANDSADETVDFFGPLCHPGDQLFAAKRFRRLAPGDLVAIMDAGAYFIPNQMNFSHPRPPAVMVGDGATSLLRARESFSDIVRLDRTDMAGALGLATTPDGAP